MSCKFKSGCTFKDPNCNWCKNMDIFTPEYNWKIEYTIKASRIRKVINWLKSWFK
jgi:hypothetical protein